MIADRVKGATLPSSGPEAPTTGGSALEGLETHHRRLMGRFLAGVAKGMLHHFGEPTSKGGEGSGGVGHDQEQKSPAWTERAPPANGNLRGLFLPLPKGWNGSPGKTPI